MLRWAYADVHAPQLSLGFRFRPRQKSILLELGRVAIDGSASDAEVADGEAGPAAPGTPGSTVQEMLESDLKLEYEVRENLANAIALCERVGDYQTREILEVQLADTEEDHAYWLEQQLRLIKMVGEQNYLQSQM